MGMLCKPWLLVTQVVWQGLQVDGQGMWLEAVSKFGANVYAHTQSKRICSTLHVGMPLHALVS